MIIIEEDENDRIDVRYDDDLPEEEEELSPEEEQYRNAVGLMEAMDCVERFERGVASLEDAASRFDALGDYRDSRSKAVECRKQAKLLDKQGRAKAYQQAMDLYEVSATKQDYRVALSEFERLKPYQESQKFIDSCKQAVMRFETKELWRNRAIALLILCFIAVMIWLVWTHI